LLVARPLNKVRAALGLPPVRRLFRWWLSPELVVGLFPDCYAARQTDWPAQLRLAGFGRYDGDRGGDLADDVRTFCRSGSAPVAFTLGTGMTHAAGFFRAAVTACELLGARGVLLTKYPHQLLARLMTTEVRARCRVVADRVGEVDGLDVAADWVEELAARSVTPARDRDTRGTDPSGEPD